MGKFRDLNGSLFYRLKVIAFGGMSKYGRATWLCKCTCGNIVRVRSSDLLLGKTKSCGCLNIDKIRNRSRTHGESNRSREYTAWANMNSRCFNANSIGYKDYGGRGITVCDEWRTSFSKFLSDMGRSPGRRYSLDRKNNNLGYYKDNCRWADSVTQGNNTRRNRMILFDGEEKTLRQWCEHLSLDYSIVNQRLWRGWSVDKAFKTIPKCRIKYGLVL